MLLRFAHTCSRVYCSLYFLPTARNILTIQSLFTDTPCSLGLLWTSDKPRRTELYLTTPLLLSALQLFVSFGLLNYFFSLLPLLRPLFQIGHSHLHQIIPHIVFPSYSWPSLLSCCMRFPFVYGLGHSFISHSYYMPQPARIFPGWSTVRTFHVLKYILSFLLLSTRFGLLLFIRPAFNNWAFFFAVLIFSGTRLLALCPTPNLEGQGVSLRLVSTLWPVWLGRPYR